MISTAPTPEVIYIPTLFRRVAEGEVRIPAFQRNFVWKAEQVIELLRSIYKGFPIGSLLFWRTEHVRFAEMDRSDTPLPGKNSSTRVLYVLDGMQRLSSLYGVFHFDQVNQNKYPEFDVAFDLNSEDFINISGLDSSQIPVNAIHLYNIFNPRKMLSEQNKIVVAENSDHLFDNLFKLQTAFQEYLIPTVTIVNEVVEEVAEIFERINNTGVRLSSVDFVRALTWSNDFDLADEINGIKDGIRVTGFDIDDEAIMKSIAMAAGKNPNIEDMLSMRFINRQTLLGYVNDAERAISRTVDYLKQYYRMGSYDFIPYEGQFLYLVKAFILQPNPSKKLLDALWSWYWTISLNEGLRGKPDSYITNYLAKLQIAISTSDFGISKEYIKFNGTELRDRKLISGAALSSAVYNLFAINGARSLTTGELIDPEEYMNKFEGKNFASIVDVSKIRRLANRQSSSQKALTNLILVTNDEAREIQRGNLVPKELIEDLSQSSSGRSILKSQFIDQGLIEHTDRPPLFILHRSFYMRDAFLKVLKLKD
ncbi:DUF262 domain-containing protein [Deinococcus koreensis]|uniref:GmrSD restriction endonucleases N-terminal domain-containing protein n=1 Tax=Deinococcus koreensis TaxID=2054903 RepID=A0A2K3V258_9DEIO|nr:DUF262 domain-containing protein [Deinococcus koreensis]PNY82864.1 hypothetical protein CVO96_04490 [Deinococcus koreensis]